VLKLLLLLVVEILFVVLLPECVRGRHGRSNR
jgi:hypothetical protein